MMIKTDFPNSVKITLIYGLTGCLISYLLRGWDVIIPAYAASAFLIMGGLGASPVFDALFCAIGRYDPYDPEPFEKAGVHQGIAVLFLTIIFILPGFSWFLVSICCGLGLLLALIPNWEEQIYDNFIMLIVGSIAFTVLNALTLGYI